MALVVMAEGKAKYVFYFIGDGMGVNQVNGTETYMAAVEGRIGTSPLCFAQFPYVGLVTTYSGTNGVTILPPEERPLLPETKRKTEHWASSPT